MFRLTLGVLFLCQVSCTLIGNDFYPPSTSTATNDEILTNDNGPGSTDGCPLNCRNGGECQRGIQNLQGHMIHPVTGVALSFHKELNRNGWYCKCPAGVTGIECQTPFHSCAENTNHVCYHGGICKTGVNDDSSFYGTGESYCDCTSAADPDNSLLQFSGEYCQEAIIDVDACNNAGICKHGGSCKDDPSNPCECTEGYFGRTCEFVREVASECEKECRNGGECRFDGMDTSKEYCDCPSLFDGEFCEEPLAPGLEDFKLINCSLPCENGGECALTGDDHTEAFCNCPESVYGDLCEIEEEQCGERYCQNGGKCFEVELSSGIIEYMCDCTPGYTNEHYYSGEYCQYESTVFCSPYDDPNGRQFCTNGGECPVEDHRPCNCPDGFSGPRCAFQNGVDGIDYAECQLDCRNGGTCQKGVKDLEQVYGKFSGGLVDMLNQSNIDFEHCVCPDGFYGIRCEYMIEECGDTGHVCLHGATCSKSKRGSSCECEASEEMVAGIYCEFPATDQCDTSSALPGQDHRGFCTNDGLCVISDGELSCMCPDGFGGLHCEFRLSEIGKGKQPWETTNPNTESGIPASTKLILAIVIFAISGIMMWIAIFHPKLVSRRVATNSLEYDGPATNDSRQLNGGLREVDII